MDEHFKGHAQGRLVCVLIHGSPLIEILPCAHKKDVQRIVALYRAVVRFAMMFAALERP